MTATYLYCVVHAAREPDVSAAPAGLAHATPPELIAVAKALWVVSASVPLDIYGPDRLDRQLSDLEWVGTAAVAHEAVVEYFARDVECTVVPMKLFTMFSNAERAVKDVASRKSAIESAVRRIAGAEEWGIRVTRSAPSDLANRAPAAAAVTGSGFLAAKKQARDDARRASAAAVEAADDAFGRLAAFARDSKRREEGTVAGATPPLLEAAFLVALKRREQFKKAAKQAADACANAGALLTLTGPWPAYNFVQMD